MTYKLIVSAKGRKIEKRPLSASEMIDRDKIKGDDASKRAIQAEIEQQRELDIYALKTSQFDVFRVIVARLLS